MAADQTFPALEKVGKVMEEMYAACRNCLKDG